MRKTILALLAIVLSTLLITLTPVGPIFVYGWLVPIVDPLIPKPKDVPSRADASYQWKGFGLVWTWEDYVPAGCARWWAAEGFNGPVRGLDLYQGDRDCDGGSRTMSRLSFVDTTTYGTGANEWPYEECPFTLDEETIAQYRTQIDALREANSGTLETQMLEAMRTELAAIDGKNMVAQQYGCRANQG